MPPKAEVLLVEDNTRRREEYNRSLSAAGHRVTAAITHVDRALESILFYRERGMRFDVAIIDGNLGYSNNGSDGVQVAGVLRAAMPDVKIIGLDFKSWGSPVADVNINRKETPPGKLVEVVTEL